MTKITKNPTTQLGMATEIPSSPHDAKLDRIKNPHTDKNYVARFTCPEFTSLCPVTGQPDFATIEIKYIPNLLIVELKSLKLYLQGFRNVGVFHEDVANKILDDIRFVCNPRKIDVVGRFNPRGGISTIVEVGWLE
mgnify:CR=1 FL=1